MLYNEKLKPLLNDIENKEIELAGGSTVGMVLSITNSLIDYICNLTIGKKKYEDVQDEVLVIKKETENLRNETLEIIDKDKEVLEKILTSYKVRRENANQFEKANREAVEFCVKVTQKAVETLKLVERISKVGNRMLESDFKICKIYAFASIEASIVNVECNLNFVSDEEFKKKIRNTYNKEYEDARNLI